MGDYKKLQVWQAAHALACEIYQSTQDFPKTEAYGLTSQLRRSAASVAANLAEGSGRNGDPEFSRYVRISLRSAAELEYHLLLSRYWLATRLDVPTTLSGSEKNPRHARRTVEGPEAKTLNAPAFKHLAKSKHPIAGSQ